MQQNHTGEGGATNRCHRDYISFLSEESHNRLNAIINIVDLMSDLLNDRGEQETANDINAKGMGNLLYLMSCELNEVRLGVFQPENIFSDEDADLGLKLVKACGLRKSVEIYHQFAETGGVDHVNEK